jgi:hypothetical protein
MPILIPCGCIIIIPGRICIIGTIGRIIPITSIHFNKYLLFTQTWSYGSSRHRVESSEATWNLSFWHF